MDLFKNTFSRGAAMFRFPKVPVDTTKISSGELFPISDVWV